MYCNQCGTYLNDDVKFCSKCGNQVSEQNQQTSNENQKSCEEIAYQLKNDGFILISDTDKAQEWKNFDSGKILEVEKLDGGKCKIKTEQSFSYSNIKQENISKPKNNTKMKIIIGVIVAIVLGLIAWQQMRVQFGKEEYDLGEKARKQQDFQMAAKHYEKSCGYGNIGACNNLGVLYQRGKGVDKDEYKAVDFYQKACDGGEMLGCTNLGVMHERGIGVEKDESKAVDLYKKACDGREMDACSRLGLMYAKGTGVVKDMVKAINFFQKACDGGEMLGCTNLGVMHETGDGVAKNISMAVKYYQQGCDSGNDWGCEQLQRLNSAEAVEAVPSE